MHFPYARFEYESFLVTPESPFEFCHLFFFQGLSCFLALTENKLIVPITRRFLFSLKFHVLARIAFFAKK